MLLIGLGGVTLSAICLGLSKTIQMIVLSRILAGVFNANYTVLRSSMGDVLSQKDFARMIAWLPAVWCISAISGYVFRLRPPFTSSDGLFTVH